MAHAVVNLPGCPPTPPALSAMLPLRTPDFPDPLPLVALPMTGLTASQIAMAIEYVSSPVPHPALQILTGPELSVVLRLQSCGNTCRVSAFSAPECRKNPVLVLINPSSKEGSSNGSCSDERSRSRRVVEEFNSCASMKSATRPASVLLGLSSTTPVWRSTSRRSSEISCSRIVLVAISLCIGLFPERGEGAPTPILFQLICDPVKIKFPFFETSTSSAFAGGTI